MKLTEPQINSLRIVLLILEKRLDEIGELCGISEKQGVLYMIKNSLNAQEAKQVKDKIAEIKRVIARLAKQLNLEKQKSDIKNIIAGSLSLSWEDLCSVDSKGMKNYGRVDESVKTELDPVINQLIRSVNKIKDLTKLKK